MTFASKFTFPSIAVVIGLHKSWMNPIWDQQESSSLQAKAELSNERRFTEKGDLPRNASTGARLMNLAPISLAWSCRYQTSFLSIASCSLSSKDPIDLVRFWKVFLDEYDIRAWFEDVLSSSWLDPWLRFHTLELKSRLGNKVRRPHATSED
jgi:hypothetical protein